DLQVIGGDRYLPLVLPRPLARAVAAEEPVQPLEVALAADLEGLVVGEAAAAAVLEREVRVLLLQLPHPTVHELVVVTLGAGEVPDPILSGDDRERWSVGDRLPSRRRCPDGLTVRHEARKGLVGLLRALALRGRGGAGLCLRRLAGLGVLRLGLRPGRWLGRRVRRPGGGGRRNRRPGRPEGYGCGQAEPQRHPP